jgi:hypothetical protein
MFLMYSSVAYAAEVTLAWRRKLVTGKLYKRHHRRGYFFWGDRFKSVIVENGGEIN